MPVTLSYPIYAVKSGRAINSLFSTHFGDFNNEYAAETEDKELDKFLYKAVKNKIAWCENNKYAIPIPSVIIPKIQSKDLENILLIIINVQWEIKNQYCSRILPALGIISNLFLTFFSAIAFIVALQLTLKENFENWTDKLVRAITYTSSASFFLILMIIYHFSDASRNLANLGRKIDNKILGIKDLPYEELLPVHRKILFNLIRFGMFILVVYQLAISSFKFAEEAISTGQDAVEAGIINFSESFIKTMAWAAIGIGLLPTTAFTYCFVKPLEEYIKIKWLLQAKLDEGFLKNPVVVTSLEKQVVFSSLLTRGQEANYSTFANPMNKVSPVSESQVNMRSLSTPVPPPPSDASNERLVNVPSVNF